MLAGAFVFFVIGFIFPLFWLFVPFTLLGIPFYPAFKSTMPDLMEKRFGKKEKNLKEV